jgi:hypothetical protein
MLDVVAGAIARSIFKTKAQLVAKTPLASQIEAPDPDDKNPVLPVHPGVVLFDKFQQYFLSGRHGSEHGRLRIALLAGASPRTSSGTSRQSASIKTSH